MLSCGTDHFRAKDYGTSAEMFEKSMLYLPYDIEKRILRAKGFRVLCLCHLGLSQLDRAEEYINEAEKVSCITTTRRGVHLLEQEDIHLPTS